MLEIIRIMELINELKMQIAQVNEFNSQVASILEKEREHNLEAFSVLSKGFETLNDNEKTGNRLFEELTHHVKTLYQGVQNIHERINNLEMRYGRTIERSNSRIDNLPPLKG